MQIFIIGAPKYTCEVSTSTIEAGKEALNLALDRIKAVIEEAKGEFDIDKSVTIYINLAVHRWRHKRAFEGVDKRIGRSADGGERRIRRRIR